MKQSSTLPLHHQFRVSHRLYRHLPMPLVTFLLAYSSALWVARTSSLGDQYVVLN